MGINLGPSINVKGQTTRLDGVPITRHVLTFVDKINNHVMLCTMFNQSGWRTPLNLWNTPCYWDSVKFDDLSIIFIALDINRYRVHAK